MGRKELAGSGGAFGADVGEYTPEGGVHKIANERSCEIAVRER